jgi:anaerobic ribonucleoside-triphosphate reductase
MMLFVIKNHNIYQANNNIHKINTRWHKKFVSSVRLSSIQKGVHYTSVRLYNNLPHNIHILKDNINIFKERLKDFIISNALYSIDEYMLSKQV